MAKKAPDPAPIATASISGGPVFGWNRLWVPQTGSIQMTLTWDDGESYIADPDVQGWGAQQNAHLKKTGELLLRRAGCVVLTGDPGMGKTQALTRFLDAQKSAGFLRVEFRDIPDAATFADLTIKSSEWMKWRRGKSLLTLAVDGVDEGLIKITGFISYLTGILRKVSLSRLQVIVVCRSQEWPHSEGVALQALWQKVPEAHCGVFELCPLLERDVLLAAQIVLGTTVQTKTAEEFLHAVRRHHVIGLSSRPITLKMLLSEFVNGGGFSVSHRDLYLRSAERLCNEVDSERRSRLRNVNLPRLLLDQRRRLRVAQRIAALLLLGGRSAVWLGADSAKSPTDLSVGDICNEAESIDGVEFTVDQAMVDAALETPLFWARGPHRAAFYHQTFAECLAAEYLKNLPLIQLRSLFCRRDAHGEFVHPQLGELAAWLAASSPVFLQHLLKNDPETLLRTDVSALKQNARVELVDAVFAKARAEQMFDDRGLAKFFHTLKHPGLAAQVRPVLCDRGASAVTMRIALEIVEECKLTELFEDVAAILDKPKASGVHSLVARTLTHIADVSHSAKVIDLFTQQRTPPLSAGAHLALVNGILKRKFWTLTQSLPHLGSFMSRYDSSGAVLAQHALPADAEGLLDATRRWGDAFDGLSPRHGLAHAGVRLGLSRINEPKIRRRLARLWWQTRRNHHESPFATRDDEGGKTFTQWMEDPDSRREFVDDVVAIVSEETNSDERLFMIDEFARVDDFEYHLDRLEKSATQLKRAYAELVATSWNAVKHAKFLGRLIKAHDNSPELQQTMAWFRTWPLDDPLTLRTKEIYYEQQKWRKEASARRKPRVKPETVWDRDYVNLKPQRPETLLTLIFHMFYRGDEPKSEELERRDLRTSPGWKYFSKKKQTSILAALRRFILTVPGNPSHQPGGNNQWDEQAYRALYALKNEIETSPAVAAAVRTNWLPIIFDEFSNADEHHLAMMAIGYRLDPVMMREMLRSTLLRFSGPQGRHCYVLREFGRCWNPELARFTVQVASTELTSAETIRAVADYLAEHDAAAAIQLYRNLRSQRAAKEACFRAVAAAVVSRRLLEHWAEVWPDLVADKAMAQEILAGLDPHHQKELFEKVQSGAERKLADLYLYLRKLFPPAEDPREEPGRVFSVTPRMEIARTRDQMTTTLSTWATDDAITELGRIAGSVPALARAGIRWKQRDAIIANRRQTWTGVAPSTLLTLARKATRRLIEDEGDLLAVVVESMERFNRNLTRRPNSPKRDFWVERTGRGRTKYFKPRDEVYMTARIASWLESDLDPDRGITLQREVQVQWDQRTDIEVRAVAVQDSALRPVQLVIEVKGCWHPQVRKAMRSQLGGMYLQKAGWTHGLYLVVWTACDRWNDPKDKRSVKTKAKTIDGAREELETLAEVFDGVREPWVIQSFVLDARL